jgi:large subunit ribosomal protein L10
MARPEKVAVVEEIKERLESAEAVFITEYRGLTVGQQQALRRSLREADAEYKVFKMTLARRAAEEAGFSDLLGWLEGPTAIAFTSGDPVPTAKSLKEFADGNDRLVLKGGMLSGATLDADAVRRLADIEPREVLLAKLAGAMSAPMSKLVGLFNAILRQPATAMQQLLEKKQADPSLGATAPTGAATSKEESDAPASDEKVAAEAAAAGSAAEGSPEDSETEEAAAEKPDAAEAGEEPAEEAAAESGDGEDGVPAAESVTEESAETDADAEPAAEAGPDAHEDAASSAEESDK